MTMNVLVTGGAGFIGSHVAENLVQAGMKVVCLDDLSGGSVENVPRGATFIKGSITDGALVDGLFQEHRFRHVYHLAAYAAEGLSHFIRHFNYTNNVIGSINLINASIRNEVERFVFTSSIAVYGHGHGSDGAFRESDVPQPADPYGIAKLAVEQDLRAAYDMFGMRFTIFRPHNVYGERQNAGDRYRNVIAIFMRQILEGSPLTIFGDGTQTRAFTYVGDVARDIARCCDLPVTINQTYNIGSSEVVSVTDLAHRVNRVMAGQQPIRNLPARNEVKHAVSDHTLFFRDFGNHTTTALDTGLQRMAEWIGKHGAKKSPRFGDIEILRNLPSVWLED